MAVDKLTPERWEAARKVLMGESGEGTSQEAAARAAGINRKTLRRWIKRSEERRPGDAPWVWKIAEELRRAKRAQEDRLIDALWRKAHGKHSGHAPTIFRLLEKINPERWRRAPAKQPNVPAMSHEEVMRWLRNTIHLTASRREYEREQGLTDTKPKKPEQTLH